MTNYSNYNPDEILEDPDAHPIHKKYAEINIGIRDRNEHWAKCLNCGEPFRNDMGYSFELCSKQCDAEFGNSLSGF